jgi:hypothetical protein
LANDMFRKPAAQQQKIFASALRLSGRGVHFRSASFSFARYY